MPKPYPKEFRDDVVAVARRRDPKTTLKQIAAATVVPAFARPERRAPGKKKWKDREVLRRSSDPDCGYYVRKKDNRDDQEGVRGGDKFIWGREATFVVCAHVAANGEPPLPVLVVAMPPLHEPGREPGRNAMRGLTSLRRRGHPAGRLAGDLAYSSSKPEDFQLPARAHGYDLVITYKLDQLGVQDEAQGLLQVEGQWYCPAMPQPLIDSTIDHRAGRIDDATYASRLEARRAYQARRNGRPDKDGYQRWLCPAAQGSPTARCSLKPKTDIFDGAVPVRIRPTKELQEQPPRCCRQESVTISPEAGAKFSQDLPFGTPEHKRTFGPLRNSVEGTNGSLKDGGHEGMADPQRRRIRGVAAQTILVAFQVLAGNLRRIDGFLNRMAAEETSGPRRRSRRRTSAPIGNWLTPRSGPPAGRSPPDSEQSGGS